MLLFDSKRNILIFPEVGIIIPPGNYKPHYEGQYVLSNYRWCVMTPILSIKHDWTVAKIWSHEPFALLSYFWWSCSCVPEVVAPSYVVSFLYPGKASFLSILLLCRLMMCANNWVYHGPMVLILRLHVTIPLQKYHYADVFESIELLKCFSDTFCRVCVQD